MKDNKIKVFIDFEAITNNYLKRLPINLNIRFLPYCYTIGIYRDNDPKKAFMTRTSIMSFKSFKYRVYINKLKSNLLSDISILAKEEITIQNIKNKVEFYGWNPEMENVILNKLFNTNCFNVSRHKGRPVALKIIVPHLENVDYFPQTKKILTEKFDDINIEEFNEPGFACSYLGYIRLCLFNKFKMPGKIRITQLDFQTIDSEIVNYNKEDVIKLDYCYKNQEIILDRSRKLESINQRIGKSSQELHSQRNQLKRFKKFALDDKKKTQHIDIENLKKTTEYQIQELKSLLNFMKSLPENVATIEEAIMWSELKIENTEDRLQNLRKEKVEL
ncbi:hypothetical protein [Mycoplasmopsis verecunda]|uniref:DUF2779 domain-containing protein n=1 Tax=Mycoplasmopsis verecunda TaxID=171291 RepID=A0A1T4L6L4_9BACT|nr:hypothetical protein [Mycoplasmopsis verecunda]WPB54778.1 hypothetical protein SAM46_01310 [Mycoplasmopsis verecunda]SJZ50356.1 hypothetical protein SAMN02745154_00345 [Mycoplasmopsis verecunda]